MATQYKVGPKIVTYVFADITQPNYKCKYIDMLLKIKVYQDCT